MKMSHVTKTRKKIHRVCQVPKSPQVEKQEYVSLVVSKKTKSEKPLLKFLKN